MTGEGVAAQKGERSWPMPRVVPSQVVAVIDQSFPDAQTTPDFPIYSASAGLLSAIVRG